MNKVYLPFSKLSWKKYIWNSSLCWLICFAAGIATYQDQDPEYRVFLAALTGFCVGVTFFAMIFQYFVAEKS